MFIKFRILYLWNSFVSRKNRNCFFPSIDSKFCNILFHFVSILFIFLSLQGVVFINGFNLGRYWPVKGPQITLFVPAGVLQPYPADNKLILLELENAPCGATNELTGKCAVTFQDYPIINATTTSNMFATPFQPINFDWHREH